MKTFACDMDLMPTLFETFLEMWDETLTSFETVWTRMPNGQFNGADNQRALRLFSSDGNDKSFNGLELHLMPMSPSQVLFPPLR